MHKCVVSVWSDVWSQCVVTVCGQCVVTVCDHSAWSVRGHRVWSSVWLQKGLACCSSGASILFVLITRATTELHSQLCFCLFCFGDGVLYWSTTCQVGYTNCSCRNTCLCLLRAEITSMHLLAWLFFFFNPHEFWGSYSYLGACKVGTLPTDLSPKPSNQGFKSYTSFPVSELFRN